MKLNLTADALKKQHIRKTKSLFLSAISALGLATSTMAQVPNYVPTNGLAAWYSFSGNADDDSGNGNNGTVNGSTLTTGKQSLPNSAYAFNGQNNTIGLSNPFLGGTQVNEFSFHVLLYLNTINSSHQIWSKTLFWGEIGFSITAQNEISFFWANSITGNKYSNIYSQPNTVQANQWYDIVVTFQNSSGQIYLNAVPIQTNLLWSAQGGSTISNSQTEASCNFAQDAGSSKMGAYGNSGFLNGKIDEFGVWSVALTQNQISQLFAGQDCQNLFTSQPLNQSLNINNTAQFTVASSDPNATYQWQTDLGTGFQNLNSVGQYSGTTNDTLVVSYVTMSNNNQPFRCIINSGSCSDTSDVAVLTVINNVGLEEVAQDVLFTVYPNPAINLIQLSVDKNLIGSHYAIEDNSGRSVKEGLINSESTSIELDKLSNGTYFIRVGNIGKKSFKVIKN